jgi:hypothetical protein
MDANPKAIPPHFSTPEARAEFQKREAEAARKGAHDMMVAGVTIVASFVFVLVLVALVIIIGHVQLF